MEVIQVEASVGGKSSVDKIGLFPYHPFQIYIEA